MRVDKNLDITKNVKIIEWMKTELLMSISELFNVLFKGVKPVEGVIQDILANIIMVTYLLAKRLGIEFKEVDKKVNEKIKIAIDEDHSVERWYGDLSNLKRHINNR
ncbi:MAG: MazG-like family protein [Clostridioides sp.]|jgi:hypothetical protein|nr:MazG-like family protein [Clostridioides sp.]